MNRDIEQENKIEYDNFGVPLWFLIGSGSGFTAAMLFCLTVSTEETFFLSRISNGVYKYRFLHYNTCVENEVKKMLIENLEMSREVLKNVKKLRQALLWHRIFTIVKWGIIIAFLIIGFFQLQPYLDSLYVIYQNLGGVSGQLENIPKILQNILPKQ